MHPTIPAFTLPTGKAMPSLGLGTWQLTGQDCSRAVRTALALGYTHIDTADFYGNHAEIAEAIAGVPRERLFITSKVKPSDLQHDDLKASAARLLRELKLDYLDLLLIHWPNKEIPMAETFTALAEIVAEGKVRHIGVSNFTVRHLKEALSVSKVPIVVNQVEFHPFLYQKELLAFCKENKIRLTAYSPLARGKVFKDETLKAIGKKHGKTPGQVALRWLHERGIVVIPKASSETHLKENLDLFGFALDDEDTTAIGRLPQERLVNPPFAEFDS